MNEISQELKNFSNSFNEYIATFFPLPNGEEKKVVEAMKYSVMNGGKRLRPFLLLETTKLLTSNYNDEALKIGVALEMLHSYSLIHDDLPAMDNDDLRRGKPTCHKQFDEATAILAGDGLLTQSFEVISSHNDKLDNQQKIELIKLLSENAGAYKGVIAGQMLDIFAENNPEKNTEELIKHIEEMKTGCLIKFACEAGCIIGKASPSQRQALINYSRNIGIAFQIADDILDVEGNQELVGKTLNKDANQGKLTFVSLYGLEKSKEIAEKLIADAKNNLNIFNEKAKTLQDLAQFIIDRKM